MKNYTSPERSASLRWVLISGYVLNYIHTHLNEFTQKTEASLR